ncbi:MAG: DUF4111 domain-containing protein [Clostridia bacterium]|nr:DUF4111 domain-containing protein [Clostridia bacterium]
MEHQAVLDEICTGYKEILGDNLIGIYVHGSIAFGCFDPQRSDIDFLVVVQDAPSHEQKKQMIHLLLELDAYCPPKGLEMSVVLERFCRQFVHPTPFELHFSNAHKRRAQRDLDGYCTNMNGVDPDLAAHFTVTRAVGQVLCGKRIEDVFAPVPREAYLCSLRSDVENAAEDIHNDPVYIILNLCRIAAFIHEGVVLSKKDGGLWGINHLPEECHTLLHSALDDYLNKKNYEPSPKAEQAFVQTMLQDIFAAQPLQ